MSLLAPWFLAGLGLLALPVYLHLLRRSRPDSKHFSSLMFFEPGLQAELRRRRLDYLKLLAARLLLLAFIIFAFAQPVLQSRAVRAASSAARLVVVDVSPSMGCCGRMDRARSLASDLLTPEARLAAFDSRLRLLERAGLARLAPGAAANSFSELARALRAWQQEQKRPVEVHLISDFQRSALPAGFAGLQLPEAVALRLHPVAERAEPNWTIESVRAPARVRQAAEARVQAVIAGFHTPEAQRTAVLRVAGRDVARKTVQVPPEGRATVEFDSFDLPHGFAQCSVRLEPADALPADDGFLFAIERTDPLPVAFTGSRAAETYLRNALEAAAAGLFTIGGEAGWRQARALIAAGSLPAESEVAAAVRRGMGLMLVLSPADAARARVPVTGQKITGTRYAARSAEGYFLAQRTDPTSPLIARAGGWAGLRFYQVLAVEPGEARVLAALEDGTPLLLEQPVGEGVVLIVPFALDGVASDFPLQPAFVPFVEQAVRRLTQWEDSTAVLAAGELYAPAAGAGARSFEVLDPRGRRVLSFAESARGAAVELDQTGFWRVLRGQGREQTVAVNIDRRESDLAPAPREALELWSTAAAAGAAGGGPPPAKPLAAWLLAAALAAALVETVLASWYLGREAA
ncbi:MAG: BatA domain-containing protein [Bryobacteraceae bacterium]|nr:BatA domain-containing protein [Bryobacteraceae bacterium]